ncbi:hypothetical protein ACQ1PF_07890 [Ornithobacterium rhinotracheale]
MADRIRLVELDIDVDNLIKKSTEGKQKMIELQEQIKILKQKYSSGGVSQEQFAQGMVVLQNNLKNVQKETRTYSNLLQAHTERQSKELNIVSAKSGSINELSRALSKNKELYKSLSEEERANAEIGGRLLEVIQAQDKIYKEQHKSIGNNSVDVGNYKGQMQELITEIGGLDAVTQNLTQQMGAFGQILQGGINTIMSFIRAQKEAEASSKALAVAQGGVATATNLTSKAMKLFRIALVSTGIGAIVVLLGSLVSYLTSTQAGIDKVTQVLEPLKALFQSFIGVVQQFGEKLFNAFKNPKQVMVDLADFVKNNLINRFKAFGVILDGIIHLDFKKIGDGVIQQATGVENATDKIKNAWQSTKNFAEQAIDKGQELANLKIKIQKMENEMILTESELNRQYEAQRERAQDMTLTASQRKKAAEEALAIQNRLVAKQNELLDLRIKEKQIQNSLNDTSREDEAELNRLIAQKNNNEQQAARNRRNARKIIQGIDRQMASESKKRADEAKKAREEAYNKALATQQKIIERTSAEIEEYKKLNTAIAQSLDERLNVERTARDRRLALLSEETALKIKQAKGDEAEIAKVKQESKSKELEINNQFLKAQAELTAKSAQRELEIWTKRNQSVINSQTRLTEDLVSAEESRLTAIHDKKMENLERERELLEQAHAWDYEKQQEYDLKKLELESEFETQKANLQKQYSEQKREDERQAQALEFQQRLADLEEMNATELEKKLELENQNFALKEEALNEQYEKGKISEENYQTALEQIKRAHLNAEKKIYRETQEAKLEITRSILSDISGLISQNTALGKAVAIAETTISTYQGAQNAYTAMAKIHPALGAVAAATAVMKGLARVKKIANTQTPKAERGITLQGKSHAQGGIKLFDEFGNPIVEAEGGEDIFVLNKNASKERALLSALNIKHGGVPLTTQTNYASAGGMIARSLVTQTQSGSIQMDNATIKRIADAVRAGASEGSYLGSQNGSYHGTQKGAMLGVQENKINDEIIKSASL